MSTQFKHLFLLPFLLILLAACSKNDTDSEQDADYNGTWEINYPIPTTTGYTNLSYKIELNNSDYTESFPAYYGPPGIYNYNIWEGKIIRNGNTLQFKVNKIKVYNYNDTTKEVLDLISESTPTGSRIDFYATLSWETVTYTMTNGNLVFTADWNGDGDSDDTDETAIYTRAASE